MQPAGTRWVSYNSRSDVFELVVLADTHELDGGFVEDKLQADIERIAADDHAYWVHLGDYGNFKNMRHPKHFDPTQYAPDVTVADLGDQAVAITKRMERYKPIAHKCMGVLMGNHEWTFQHATEQWNMHAGICHSLGVPNLGYSCFVGLSFVRQPHARKRRGALHMKAPSGGGATWGRCIYMHHGVGAAQTPGGRVKKLDDAMNEYDSDLYLLAHLHGEATLKRVTVTHSPDCTEIRDRLQLGAITGSYLKTYRDGPNPSYGERKMYRAACLGAISVFFEPDKKKVWIPTVAEYS